MFNMTIFPNAYITMKSNRYANLRNLMNYDLIIDLCPYEIYEGNPKSVKTCVF